MIPVCPRFDIAPLRAFHPCWGFVNAVSESISGPALTETLESLTRAVVERHRDSPNLVLVSIANGGIALGSWLKQALESRLGRELPAGVVDITFHRDDIGLQPISKISLPTALEFSIDDTIVLLIDDVLHTGRTVRAAINELFDQGRPSAIELLVMVDRLSQRLPIRPTFAGVTRPVPEDQRVRLKLDPARPEQASIFFE